MPIIGISATVASLVPLTSLASCNKQAAFKVELKENTSKEKKLYANTSVAYFYFTQNELTHYGKTRVKLVNLKINGAEASIVSGLIKTSVDSAGGIRVTLNIETFYNHYNNPETIEFDLVFSNIKTKQSYVITGFKLTADQETEVPSPFEVDSTENTMITGFTQDLSEFTESDFANAKDGGINIFQLMTVKSGEIEDDDDDTGKDKLPQKLSFIKQEDGKTEYDTADINIQPSMKEADVFNTFYKMVIPAKYTSIAPSAFIDSGVTKIDPKIKALDFAADSKMAEIGKYAFQEAPFIFVTLPSSLETLGEACFAGTKHLMSMQFAPTNAKGTLELPEWFLAESSIPYLKLPNYIAPYKGTKTFVNGDLLYLDFTDWNPNQIEPWKDATQIASCKQIYLIANSEACGSAIIGTIGKLVKFQNADDPSKYAPYSFTQISTYASLKISKDSKTGTYLLTSILKNLAESSMKIFGIDYPIFKFEFPNYHYYYDEESKTHKTIPVGILDASNPLFKEISPFWSSVAMPSKLTALQTEAWLAGLPYLWQAYIPSTCVMLGAVLFADDTCLSSIIYDGTSSQWSGMIKNNGWNKNCGTINVSCTDKIITA